MNMPSDRPGVSETEMVVLKILWDHGPGTVREIDAQLREQDRTWAYTTVLTLLQRLQTKGYVQSDKTRTPHVFRAEVTRERFLDQRLKALAKQLAGGTATPLVHALVTGNRFSDEEIEALRQLLDEAEAREKTRRGSRKQKKEDKA